MGAEAHDDGGDRVFALLVPRRWASQPGGLGKGLAQLAVHEPCAWRRVGNRNEVSSAAGNYDHALKPALESTCAEGPSSPPRDQKAPRETGHRTEPQKTSGTPTPPRSVCASSSQVLCSPMFFPTPQSRAAPHWRAGPDDVCDTRSVLSVAPFSQVAGSAGRGSMVSGQSMTGSIGCLRE